MMLVRLLVLACLTHHAHADVAADPVVGEKEVKNRKSLQALKSFLYGYAPVYGRGDWSYSQNLNRFSGNMAYTNRYPGQQYGGGYHGQGGHYGNAGYHGDRWYNNGYMGGAGHDADYTNQYYGTANHYGQRRGYFPENADHYKGSANFGRQRGRYYEQPHGGRHWANNRDYYHPY
jgi:hypothetical protein